VTPAELDAELERLTAAAAAVSANLLDLEQAPARALLDAGTLRGETARQWQGAERALAEIFRGYTALSELLARAAQCRDDRGKTPTVRVAELTAMLTGPSIELVGDDVPLGERALLDGGRRTTRQSPDELLTAMSPAFDEAQGVVTTIGRAWDELVPRVAELRVRLGAVEFRAARTGFEAEHRALAGDLLALGDTLLADPLAVTPGRVDAAAADIDALERRCADADQLREDLDGALRLAHASLADVNATAERAATAREATRLRIRGTLPELPPIAHLAGPIRHIDELAREQRWHDAATALDEWRDTIDDVRQQLGAAIRAYEAPLTTRNELRGQIDALRAMSYALGVGENAALDGAYRAASDELFTAPTDLDVAADLVRRYHEAVSSHRPASREVCR
jgi:hypothetical protein